MAADDDPAHCKADSEVPVRVLFSNRYYIQLAALNGTSDIIVHNQSNAVAIDFDWETKCLFWSDVTSRGSSLRKVCGWDEGENRTKITTMATLRNPDGLAVDWVGRNLYWCDKGSDTVEVSNLDGEYRRVVLSEGLLEPRAIAVDPTTGFLFWSDWGAKPHIGRAWMDGSRPEVLVSKGVGWPNALAVDYSTGEVFFGDAREDYIAAMNQDGSALRKILSRSILNPGAREAIQ